MTAATPTTKLTGPTVTRSTTYTSTSPYSSAIPEQRAAQTQVVHTFAKNDYYKCPNTTELAPGDGMGFNTTYDSHHVRTFKPADSKMMKKRGQIRESPKRLPTSESSECSACVASSYTSSTGCPKGCQCRCHTKNSNAISNTVRDIKKGRRTVRDCPSDADYIKEVHIHHYHCHRRGQRAGDHRIVNDRSASLDVSSESESYEGTDYLVRASSPKKQGRKIVKYTKHQTKSAPRLAAKKVYRDDGSSGSPRFRRNTMKGRRSAPRGGSSFEIRQHPYNKFRKEGLGVRKDTDSFGVAALPQQKSANKMFCSDICVA